MLVGHAASSDGTRGKEIQMMRKLRSTWRRDDGVTTVEYAVCLLVASAFGGTMLKIVSGSTVQAALTGLVKRALG
jgi:Flp pilus assembly pilin Flp